MGVTNAQLSQQIERLRDDDLAAIMAKLDVERQAKGDGTNSGFRPAVEARLREYLRQDEGVHAGGHPEIAGQDQLVELDAFLGGVGHRGGDGRAVREQAMTG